MWELIVEHAADVVVALLSVVAVGVSLFRARANQAEAAAAAVHELAQASQDLRERINQLEVQNRHKDGVIEELRQQAALIPGLQAQIQELTTELGRLKGRHQTERDTLLAEIATQTAEIEHLRAIIRTAGLALPVPTDATPG